MVAEHHELSQSALDQQKSAQNFFIRLITRFLTFISLSPFFVFTGLFLVLPTLFLLSGAFQNSNSAFTLDNIAALATPSIRNSFWLSLTVSIASALSGAVCGFFLALCLASSTMPTALRSACLSFCGVASNFAGVPLAFAFAAKLGRMGLLTLLLRNGFGINLYDLGFNLFTFGGLTLVYLYFQIPLMVLIIMPALEGMKREWREAASNLGASTLDYWWRIGLPVLWPSLLGATLLLFANAFGAIATAFALTGPSLNIVPILLYAQIRGDVLHNANLGYALALGMVVITALSSLGYLSLRTLSERAMRGRHGANDASNDAPAGEPS